jgi:hypothetical protein
VKSLPPSLVKFSCILSWLGLSACSPPRPPLPVSGGAGVRDELAGQVRSRGKLSVLFVGNSYSFGVPRAFSKLAAERGRPVRTGHSTYGSWTLAKHAEHAATLEKIRSGWDIVVIQEQSRIPSLPPGKRDEAMFPPMRALVQEARRQGAVPLLYQTWGRRDGDEFVEGDDFHAMTARLRTGYQAAAKASGGVAVAPVGDAWEREFHAGRGAALFQDDGSHPSAAGDQLTARVFYEVLFGK